MPKCYNFTNHPSFGNKNSHKLNDIFKTVLKILFKFSGNFTISDTLKLYFLFPNWLCFCFSHLNCLLFMSTDNSWCIHFAWNLECLKCFIIQKSSDINFSHSSFLNQIQINSLFRNKSLFSVKGKEKHFLLLSIS